MTADKPNLEIFAGNKSLGQIFREQNQINIKFSEGNIPFTDTTGNTAVNWRGKTRFLMLQGANDGVGFDGTGSNAKLANFVEEMENWIQGVGNIGHIQEAIVYTDSFGNTYNVKCFDWSWTRGFGDPSRILWSLMLHEV